MLMLSKRLLHFDGDRFSAGFALQLLCFPRGELALLGQPGLLCSERTRAGGLECDVDVLELDVD